MLLCFLLRLSSMLLRTSSSMRVKYADQGGWLRFLILMPSYKSANSIRGEQGIGAVHSGYFSITRVPWRSVRRVWRYCSTAA